jgi:hypothetical protein
VEFALQLAPLIRFYQMVVKMDAVVDLMVCLNPLLK